MATVNVRDFPDALYRRVKVLAAERGLTLREAVIAAVRQWAGEAE